MSHCWYLVPSPRGGQEGRAPLMTACALRFLLTQVQFLEHHVTVRQQTMMEKEIITFKHKLFSFNVLSILCEIDDNQLPVHKCDAVIRLINMLLRKCCERALKAR